MLIASFPKNGSEEVRAQLQMHEGKSTASLWVFGVTTDGRGYAKKGKGIALSADLLPALEDAVRQLRAAAADPTYWRGA